MAWGAGPELTPSPAAILSGGAGRLLEWGEHLVPAAPQHP